MKKQDLNKLVQHEIDNAVEAKDLLEWMFTELPDARMMFESITKGRGEEFGEGWVAGIAFLAHLAKKRQRADAIEIAVAMLSSYILFMEHINDADDEEE